MLINLLINLKYFKGGMEMTYKDEKDYFAIYTHKFFHEGIEELLEKYGDVDRFNELIELIISFEDNEEFIRFGSLKKIGLSFREAIVLDSKKIPFIYCAEQGLGINHLFPLYLPEISHQLVNRDDFDCILSVIQFSYDSSSGHYLVKEEDKKIKLSDIRPYLTYFVEDFDNLDNELPEPSVDFFYRLHNLYWEDKKTRNFERKINEVLGFCYDMWSLNFRVCRTFRRGAFYLMGCNALKNNRDSIVMEDIIVGYLTAFKVALSDIRPLIDELYDEEKWADDDSWKKRLF